ncbi:MAG: hypothetical protein SP1CHLAM9_10030 [Chlamydiia bacterium]|nr:hypothetical protein [Chlamydiia bacterium]MCH9624268.1 hypothetical protein [Chlamydiia bacterium]
MKKYIVLFAISLSVHVFSTNTQIKDVTLISYPFSGNTWTRYCIEVLTSRPTVEIGSPNIINQPFGLQFDISTDFSKPYVYKAHFIRQITTDSLILLIRNPRESMLSSKITKKIKPELRLKAIKHFYEMIEYFDQLESSKYLIYYEDLMTNPREELTKLALFLGSDKPQIEKRLNAFLTNYNIHQKRVQQKYSDTVKRIKTGSKDKLLYRTSNMTKETIDYITTTLREYNPYLYEKYLSRFE